MIADILIILLCLSVTGILLYQIREMLPLKARLEDILKQVAEERAKAREESPIIYDREVSIPFALLGDILSQYRQTKAVVQGEEEIQTYYCEETNATIKLVIALDGDRLVKRITVAQPNCDVQCSTKHIQRISVLLQQYKRVVVDKGVRFYLSPNNRELRINPNLFHPYEDFIRLLFPYFNHEIRHGSVYVLNGDIAARPDLLAIALALTIGEEMASCCKVAVGTGDVVQDNADIMIIYHPHPSAINAALHSRLSYSPATYILIQASDIPDAKFVPLRRLTPHEIVEIAQSTHFSSLIKQIPSGEAYLQEVFKQGTTTAVVPASEARKEKAAYQETLRERK